MKQILLWIWCLPQNLFGLALKLVTRAKRKGNHYEYKIPFGSVSLGEYIFLCPNHRHDITTLKHEHGHRVQSRIFGWLYLPCIALLSFLWACVYAIFGGLLKKVGITYYWWFTEKWADQIAGIDRSKE